jgi:hypothetical protein
MKNETDIEENCKLNMIRIPEEIGGKVSFYQFFQACLNTNQRGPSKKNNINLGENNKDQKGDENDNSGGHIIPIGIFRVPNPKVLGNETHYIITNPDKNTPLLVRKLPLNEIIYI